MCPIKIELRTQLICWHASPMSHQESILRDGLRVSSEGIYFGLHPGVASTHGERAYGGAYTVYTIVLPLCGQERYSWDEHFFLTHYEGYSRRNISRHLLVEHVSSAEARQRLSAAGNAGFDSWAKDLKDGIYACGTPVLQGYNAWLDEEQFRSQLWELLNAPLRDPVRSIMAAYYVSRLPESRTGALWERVLVALRTAVFQAVLLPEGAFMMGLNLMHDQRQWLDEQLVVSAVREWPFQYVALLLAWIGPHDAIVSQLLRVIRRESGEARYQQLCYLAQVFGHNTASNAVELPPADGVFVNAIVQTLRRANVGFHNGSFLIDYVARLSSELGDKALIDLFYHQRQIPCRCRALVHRHLKLRAQRLAEELQCISYDGPLRVRVAAAALIQKARGL